MADAFSVEFLYLQEETIQGFGRTAKDMVGEFFMDGDEFTIDRTIRPDPNSASGYIHEGLIVIRRPYTRTGDDA